MSINRRLHCIRHLSYWITQANEKYFCLLAQIVGAFLWYIGVAKSDSALSFAELARVYEIISLEKLQNCKDIEFF